MEKKVFEKMLEFYVMRAEDMIREKIDEISDKNEKEVSYDDILQLKNTFIKAGYEIDLLFNKAERIAALEEAVQENKQKLEESLNCWK